MRSISIAAVTLVAAAPAAAEEIPRFAKVAAEVGNALKDGYVSSVGDLLPEVSDAELAVLETLHRCDGTFGSRNTKNFVQIFWTCPPSTIEHLSSLQTAMRFTDSGEMFAMEINPVFEDFPVDTTGDMAELPECSSITKQFARAVKNGDDVTLGGLIPIAEFQHAQLQAIEATRFFYRELRDENQHPVLFHGRGLPRDAQRQVSVHFDDNGRPLGISVVLAHIRKETTTTTAPF